LYHRHDDRAGFEHERNLAAEQIIDCRAGAFVWHVYQLDASHDLEHLTAICVLLPNPAEPYAILPDLRAPYRSLLQCARAERRMHDDHKTAGIGDVADRREIAQRIVRAACGKPPG
jgi:hypothetical protein